MVVGTRDPEVTRQRGESFGEWLEAHPDAGLTTFGEAAADTELVVNATSGPGALPALEAAGSDHLAGKVVVDISNPLDFSAGFPPTLFVKDTDSLAEQIQRAFPQARVVKTLNTLTAALMVKPAELGADSSVFVSGNDEAAKATVTELLQSFGHTDVIDLGDLSTARGTEMLLPVWLRLMGALGTATFNFKIVR
ncbi:hypothetical protein SAMN04489867_3343 [Pedococcus dokdonensis]|uniref:Pyrroline-5-carboxylate reductase catalytic N-terminal domain-containing protein n=1 Tax=Pedococcus dokdonensis TaxID=443156 RepID=A0A1H0UIB1_9MICO|nr:hypothetical protein SAMN04489867_3343 [Pedococcus dokdonensis]